MTNEDIIYTEAIDNEIYTKDQADALIKAGKDLGIHTYQVWKSIGYQVKKGQKAKIKTNLWRYREERTDKDGTVVKQAGYYMTKSYLFTKDQVEKIS